jgi:hypothetical protein
MGAVLTVAEVCERMGFSPQTVIRIFEQEPGVLIKESPQIGTGKRRYRAFRIPLHVYDRVIGRMTKPAP